MKFLFSPLGLIIIVVLALIIFLPRRLPDKAKKFGIPFRRWRGGPKAPGADRSWLGRRLIAAELACRSLLLASARCSYILRWFSWAGDEAYTRQPDTFAHL